MQLTTSCSGRDGERLLHVTSRPGVFSHRRVDPGARRLLEAMEAAFADDAANALQLTTYYGHRGTEQFQAITAPPKSPAQNSPLNPGGVIMLGRDYGGAEPMPEVGRRDVVLDGSGRRAAVIETVEFKDYNQVVPYGSTGRVKLYTMTKELFVPGFMERDEGEREKPHDKYPWDGISGTRPFHEFAATTTVGVY